MRSVFLSVVEMSVTASYVIAAVLAVRLLMRNAPRKYSYLLWAAAGFRLCCPFSFESALSLFNLRRAAEVKVQTEMTGVMIERIPAGVTAIPPAVQPPAVMIAPSVTESAVKAVDFSGIAAVIWLIGMAVMIGYAVFSYVRLKRDLRTAVRLEKNIRQADGIRSPFILGIFRPRIYIPFGLEGEKLDYVLAHERCHLKRLDHIIRPVAFLVLTVHWFNPLVWLSFYLMGQDMEMSCDEKVLGSRENIRKSYSTTLLSFAAERNFPLTGPLAFGESSVKSRIKNILSWKKPTVLMTAAAVTLSVIALIVCVSDPKDVIENVTGMRYRGQEISAEAADELTDMINSAGRSVRSRNYPRSADDDEIVMISCGDGGSYELHYWYNSGFSFRQGKEDPYCSMLTKYDADGKAKRTWKLEEDFDAHFQGWLEYHIRAGEKKTASSFAVPEVVFTGETESAYVPWQCIYMTPFSSYYPAGGDSGERYLADEHGFTIQNRQSGAEQRFFTDWEWGEFPYTVEEWNEFQAPLGDVELDYFSDRECVSLSGDYDLLRMNGVLWLVKYGSHPDGERYIWSIYSLMPEKAMGSAQWEHKPYLSSVYPAFPFRFDLGDLVFDEVSVFCSEGSLIDFDAKGNQAIDTLLTLPAGSRIYWNPWKPEKEGAAGSAVLSFTGYEDGKNVFAGSIYITGEGELYTARLVGTGLCLGQAEEGGGLITLMEDSYEKRADYSDGTPGGDVSQPGGTLMWRQGEAGIQLTLPEGWRGDFYQNEAGRGVSFGPADKALRFELLYHEDTPAICGTGVTFSDQQLKNGDMVAFATEKIGDEVSLHIFFGEEYEHYRLDGSVPAAKWPEYRQELTDILGTVKLGEEVPETDQGYAVTFTGKDRYSTSSDSVTYRNPGSGADTFSFSNVIRQPTEPMEPFEVDFRLPYGWSVRQPEGGEATYAAMTFQPMNLYDEGGNFAGTMGFNTFTAEQAEIHSGEEPDGKWGPENYRGIYWTIMSGYFSWDNDFSFVGDPEDGIAMCRVKYDAASPMVDRTAYNDGVLAYDGELMRWVGFEILDGMMSGEELTRLAESIRFAPAEKGEGAPLPAPGKVPAGWRQAILGLTYHQTDGIASGTGKLCNVSLALPEGWVLSTPGDAVYGSPIDPTASLIDDKGNYIATVHRKKYIPVPEAAGQWNEFRAVYSDIMLGSGYSWGLAYTPVTRSASGETATDEIWYADWFLGTEEPVAGKGILSYDSRYEMYIAIEFHGEVSEELVRAMAESIKFE